MTAKNCASCAKWGRPGDRSFMRECLEPKNHVVRNKATFRRTTIGKDGCSSHRPQNKQEPTK